MVLTRVEYTVIVTDQRLSVAVFTGVETNKRVHMLYNVVRQKKRNNIFLLRDLGICPRMRDVL